MNCLCEHPSDAHEGEHNAGACLVAECGCPAFKPQGTQAVPIASVFHDFGWALRRLRKGERLRRKHWPAHEHIALDSKTGPVPYIFKAWDADPVFVAWRPAQDDLLATDWEVVQ